MNNREYTFFLLGADNFDVCKTIRNLCEKEGMDTMYFTIMSIVDEFLAYDNLLPNEGFYDNFTNFVDKLFKKEILEFLNGEIETFHVIPNFKINQIYLGYVLKRANDVYDFLENESPLSLEWDDEYGLVINLYDDEEQVGWNYYPECDLISDTQDLKKLMYIFEGGEL